MNLSFALTKPSCSSNMLSSSLQALNRQLPSSDVFGPWELLDALSKEDEELGLIVDLTFTTRYYKVEVCRAAVSPLWLCPRLHSSIKATGSLCFCRKLLCDWRMSVFHSEPCVCLCVQDVPSSLLCVKIFTRGHEVPSDDTILSFKRAVRRFLRENEDNGERTCHVLESN